MERTLEEEVQKNAGALFTKDSPLIISKEAVGIIENTRPDLIPRFKQLVQEGVIVVEE